jgi:hypothetical protein
MDIVGALLSRFNIDPEQVRTLGESARNEFANAKESFKRAYTHFDSRSTRIEKMVRAIAAAQGLTFDENGEVIAPPLQLTTAKEKFNGKNTKSSGQSSAPASEPSE